MAEIETQDKLAIARMNIENIEDLENIIFSRILINRMKRKEVR